MEKRIKAFTNKRFYSHFKNLIDIGMEAGRYADMFDTLYLLTDLNDFINELKAKNKVK